MRLHPTSPLKNDTAKVSSDYDLTPEFTFNSNLKFRVGKREQWHQEATVKFPTKLALIVEKAPNSTGNLQTLTNPK